MALKINVALSLKDGGTIASRAMVKFRTTFPEDGLTVRYQMNIYRDAAHVTSKDPIIGAITQIPSMIYTHALTAGDYTSLTPLLVHDKLLVYLESLAGIGIGKVVVVS